MVGLWRPVLSQQEKAAHNLSLHLCYARYIVC